MNQAKLISAEQDGIVGNFIFFLTPKLRKGKQARAELDKAQSIETITCKGLLKHINHWVSLILSNPHLESFLSPFTFQPPLPTATPSYRTASNPKTITGDQILASDWSRRERMVPDSYEVVQD